MSLKTFFCMVSLLAIIYWGEACDVGWFGLNCQYKCRCSENACNENGTYVNGTNCLGGWFGPACQFEDIAYLKGLDNETTDGNDNTCGSDNGSSVVNVVLEKPYPITWVRVRVRSSAAADLLKAEVKDPLNSTMYTPTQTKIRVDEKTLDIIIDNDWNLRLNQKFQEVRVIGLTSHDVCSIYISGGRNVALKQSTSQSSTQFEDPIHYTSDKAVDGKTNPDFFAENTCTHTEAFQTFANWSVTLSQPKTINRILLHNRNILMERLSGFALQGYHANGTKVVDYINNPATTESVYSLSFPGLGLDIFRVDIQARQRRHILTLCEVELYGDSACEAGLHGRDCERRCNCAANETCFVSTGGCPSGCAHGYRGEACDQVCEIGKYGENCNLTCSRFCLKKSSNETSCHHIDGRCLHGCVSGYQGLDCSTPCNVGKYGENCNSTCSEFCLRPSSNERSCDHVNGRCLHGCVSGYQGLQCSTPCSSGQYGEGCRSKCSEFCLTRSSNESSCDYIDGRCLHGCVNGYQGLRCISPCSSGQYGEGCRSRCSEFCLTRLSNESSCDYIDGRCLHDCVDGYQGLRCISPCSSGQYGEGCWSRCSEFCLKRSSNESSCDYINGRCLHGCVDGYQEMRCILPCSPGKFGKNCKYKCSKFCLKSPLHERSCHHVDGRCLLGCVIGYKGLRCCIHI